MDQDRNGGSEASRSASILLIEDDRDLRDALASALGRVGWEVIPAASGEEALEVYGARPVDLILLDLGLPGIPGIEVLRAVRSRSDVPVMVMTAAGGLEDRVAGFDFGADDYLVKPVEVAELERRIRAVLRRSSGARPEEILHGPGGVRLLLRAHEAYVGPQQVHLTPKEFEVLRLLLHRRGEVIAPDDISVEIWGYETFGSRNYVEAHVSRLRGKLADAGARDVIGTVRGVGYMVR